MIDLVNVEVNYRGIKAIKGVTMHVESKVLLLGPNGSGKTTLLRAVAGIVPYLGSIRVDGTEVRSLKGYSSLSTNLPEVFSVGLTLDDVLSIFSDIKGLDGRRAVEMLREVGIRDLRQKTYSLSTGQSALFRTIVALATDPKIVLLDEPFENVDVANRRKVLSWIKEYGKEGIVVTHELELASSFQELDSYLIFEGKVYGPVKVGELLSSVVTEGRDPEALLVVEVEGKEFSFVKGKEGKRMADIITLDRLYSM